ncbi:Os01g0227350, partial [Oryza sativa Japonica Group]
MTGGWLMSSAMAHSKVVKVVSQHVHEVPVINVLIAVAVAVAAVRLAEAAALAVVRDDTLQQAVELRRYARRLGVEAHQLVHPRQPRHELPHRRRPEKRLEVGEQLPQLLAALVAVEAIRAVAERGARDDAVGVGHEQVAQVHGLAATANAAAAPDAVEERGDLLLPDAAEGGDAARAEEVEHADAARLAPELAVWREHHVTPIDEPLRHAHPGAARERRVAGPHGLLRRGRRRRHDGGHAAEPEQHHRPVRLGHRPELPVRQGAKKR